MHIFYPDDRRVFENIILDSPSGEDIDSVGLEKNIDGCDDIHLLLCVHVLTQSADCILGIVANTYCLCSMRNSDTYGRNVYKYGYRRIHWWLANSFTIIMYNIIH